MVRSRSNTKLNEINKTKEISEYNFNYHLTNEEGIAMQFSNQIVSLECNNKYNSDSSETSGGSTSPMLSTIDTRVDRVNNWQRSYTLLLYSITTILLFSDQNLLAPNLSAAAEEFGFNNDERDKKLGGDIALAFFLLGAPASFFVGCLADSDFIPRSFLFGLTVLIGEGACFFTYFTTTYTGLYVTRALTGFSVGGALPLLSSVLGDWFPPQQRSKVMASVSVGSGIGIAIGQGLAGFMGPVYGWRSPFLAVSVPALFIAILMMTTVKDPIRGGSEMTNYDEPEYENCENNESKVNGIDNMENVETRPTSPLEVISFESDFHDQPNNEESTDEATSEPVYKRCLNLLKPSTYKSHLRTTKELLQSKTVILTLIQGAPGCM